MRVQLADRKFERCRHDHPVRRIRSNDATVVQVATVALAFCGLDAGAVELEKLDVEHKNGQFTVSSSIVLDAPVAGVFNVLNDYDRLTELHPSIRRAEVVDRPQPTVAIVDTWIRGCAAFICRTLKRRERIETDGRAEIFARTDNSISNVDVSETRWVLIRTGDRTLVSYEASLDPQFWIPPVIGPGIVKRKLRVTLIETLTQVEALAGPK